MRLSRALLLIAVLALGCSASDTAITPFMKKHGLSPGHGWGSMAGKLNSSLAGSSGIQDVLYGLFVQPCFYYGTFMGQPVSRFDTRHYAEDFTYELDRTFYLGNADCVPNISSIFYKMQIRGVVTYHGPNVLIPNASRAQMQFLEGEYYFANNIYGQAIVNDLNTNCLCGQWSVATWRSINASVDCQPAPPSSGELCHIMSGASDYYSYQWIDPTHYITSVDDFSQVEGWTNALVPSYVREKIPESGFNDPDDCDYVHWYTCGEGIRNAQVNCAGCQGLECDGCLFREINPVWDPFSDDNNWQYCCPCIFLFAQEYEQTWMQTMC